MITKVNEDLNVLALVTKQIENRFWLAAYGKLAFGEAYFVFIVTLFLMVLFLLLDGDVCKHFF